MGLHLNIPETQMRDAGEREHRNRIWWTAYTLERISPGSRRLWRPSTLVEEPPTISPD